MAQHSPVTNPALVDVAQAWHFLAECQQQLDAAAAQARWRVRLEAPAHEDSDRLLVEIDEKADRIFLRVSVQDATPEALRAWATPDLVMLRAHACDGGLMERLVRLPASVEPGSAETERDGGVFAIALDKRSAVPTTLWSPVV